MNAVLAAIYAGILVKQPQSRAVTEWRSRGTLSILKSSHFHLG